MSEKILVPVLGESITEATVAKWLKNAGDPVEADEPVVELETDKVNLEVPSPIDGVLSEINSKDGETVEVGALLGSVSQSDDKDEQFSEKKVITKIEPITIPGLQRGIIICQRVCQALAPASLAASISDLSILIMELNMGTIIKSV